MESTQESSASSSGIQSQFGESISHESGASVLKIKDLAVPSNENENKNQVCGINMDGGEESPEFENEANKDCNAGSSNESANQNQIKDSNQSELMTVSRQAGYELSQKSSYQQQPIPVLRVTQKQDTSPKKKRRQQGINMDGSEESTESGDGANYAEGVNCSHFNKAINIPKLRRETKEKKMNNKCYECQKQDNNESQDEIADDPQLWICLHCGNVACGRGEKGHAIVHYETPRSDEHCMVIDTQTWRPWCYKCDDTVNNQNPIHKKKLQDVIELLKKWVRAKPQVQPKSPIPLRQSEMPNLLENENKTKISGLPKVGGLVNLGNTCFFNSVLQCLAQTPYLIRVLDDLQVPDQKFILIGGKHKVNDVEEELPSIQGVLETPLNFSPVLRKTLSDMQNSQGHVYRPIELYNSLRKKNNYCTDGGQHDSHELLRHLLECVRSEDVRRYQTVILDRLGLSDRSNRKNIGDNLKSQVKFYGNQANAKFLGPERAFRGELVSTLECLECGHISCREELFLDLSLPVMIDKSLPTVIKRKANNFENSVDPVGNNVQALSKHQMKKAQKLAAKNRRAGKNRNGSSASTSNPNHTSEEKKDSVAGSDESDADVEDNAENDDISAPEINESGYSSEKPSAVTSPVSLSELRSTDSKPYGFPNLNVDGDSSAYDDKEDSDKQRLTDSNITNNVANSNMNHTNFILDVVSPAENEKVDADSRNTVVSGTGSLTLSTSLAVNSDFTSPEGPTVSPLSSPLTSKDSPTSPISSAVDGEDEKVEELAPRLDNTDKNDLSDKKVLSKYPVSTKMSTGAVGGSLFNEGNGAGSGFVNGIGDITSNISKFELSTPIESLHGYPVKEGECSVQLCLNQFTALELMDGNNKVGCAACTERKNKGKKGAKMVCTDSTKQYLISKVPAVLILHLKRFQVQRCNFRKVGKNVSFPMILDLAPVTKDYTKPRIYALYGVVEHSGTLYGGHYVAYVKSRHPLKKDDPRWSFLPSKDGFENNTPNDSPNDSNSDLESGEADGAKSSQIEPPPGRWYYVSDSRVHEVDEKTVLSSEAYLLFYERLV